MRIYLSGHIPSKDETDWRTILIGHFDGLQHEKYKQKGAWQLPLIRWIHPLSDSVAKFNAARDRYLMEIADFAVINLDLNTGKCLGCMFEMGYMKRRQVPILLINHHQSMARTQFIEWNADLVVYNLKDAASALLEMLKDVHE